MSKIAIVLCALALVACSQAEQDRFEKRLAEINRVLANGREYVLKASQNILNRGESLVKLNEQFLEEDLSMQQRLRNLPDTVQEILDTAEAQGADVEDCRNLVNFPDVRRNVNRVLGARQACVDKRTGLGRAYMYRAKNAGLAIFKESSLIGLRAETCLRRASGFLAAAQKSFCIVRAEGEAAVISNIKVPTFLIDANVVVNEIDRLLSTAKTTCIADEAENLLKESEENVSTCTKNKLKSTLLEEEVPTTTYSPLFE